MLLVVPDIITAAVCDIYRNVSGSVVVISEAVCDTVALSGTCVCYGISVEKDYDQYTYHSVLQYINRDGSDR